MNTEITLPASELKIALLGLNKLVGRKPTLPVLGCVKVNRKANGLVTLQGTDLDGFATFTFSDTQAGEPWELLVSLEQLNNAFKGSVSKLDLALIREGKNTRLRYFIGGNPVLQPVNPLPLDEWPSVPEINVAGIPLQPGFGAALKQAMQCCSEDPTRQVLHGACLDARDQKSHYVVATNGRFLYSANSFTFPLKEGVLIPDSKFINSSGLLDNEPCFLAVQPGKKPAEARYLSLQNKQWQWVTREIAGKYPDWKAAIPVVNYSWTLVQLSPSAVEQMIEVIPKLPGNDNNDHAIRLRTGQQCLWIEGRNKDDADWTKIAISDVTIKGRAKEISLNREYLFQALKYGLNELAIADDLTPLTCRKDGRRIVIMPVRPTAGSTPATKPAPAPTTSTAAPPAVDEKPIAEERKTDMPTNTMTAPERDNIKAVPAEANTTKEALEKVEAMKVQLRDCLSELNDLTGLLKSVEKEKRSQDKEVASVRHTLRHLQTVRI